MTLMFGGVLEPQVRTAFTHISAVLFRTPAADATDLNSLPLLPCKLQAALAHVRRLQGVAMTTNTRIFAFVFFCGIVQKLAATRSLCLPWCVPALLLQRIYHRGWRRVRF